MTNLPQSRQFDVIVQDLESEILVYDLKINKAFVLNETAATVYRACDGKTSFAELRSKYKFTDDMIHFAINELKTENLLEDYKSGSHFGGLSRREVIRRVGLASMIALPMISSLIAPHAVHAQSGSTCPTGIGGGDPAGAQGNGDTCGCGTNVGAGTPCGRGTTGAPASTCRSGCTCRATSCSNVTNTCVGLCE